MGVLFIYCEAGFVERHIGDVQIVFAKSGARDINIRFLKMIKNLITLAEKRALPDFMIRLGIRKLCQERLDKTQIGGPEAIEKHHQKWVEKLKESPVALVPEKANEQHYEVPPEFFKLVLENI